MSSAIPPDPPPAAPAPPPPTAGPQRPGGLPPVDLLRRSASDRKIAGVCGGVGRWLDIDPLVFRIAVALLALFGGGGILLYALAWLLVPRDGSDESEAQRLVRGNVSAAAVTAIVGVVLGMSVFGGVAGGGIFGAPDLGGLVLLALVVLGLTAAVRHQRRGVPSGSTPPAVVPPPAGSGTAPGPGPTALRVADDSPTYRPSPPAYPSMPASYPVRPPIPPAPPRRVRERSLLPALTLSLAVVTGGIVALVGALSDTGPDVPVLLAAALSVVALGLLVGAVIGRARSLIPLAVLLTVALLAVTAIGLPQGGTGERVWQPTSAAEVQTPYRLGAGDARLDLTRLALTETLRVAADVSAGELTVLVPRDTDLEIEASVGVGEIELPDGVTVSGIGNERNVTVDAADGAAPTLILDLHVGIGELEVSRAAS